MQQAIRPETLKSGPDASDRWANMTVDGVPRTPLFKKGSLERLAEGLGSAFALLTAGAGFLLLTETFRNANGAPQQAAGAAMAVALAVIPYCVARGLSFSFRAPRDRALLAEISALRADIIALARCGTEET